MYVNKQSVFEKSKRRFYGKILNRRKIISHTYISWILEQLIYTLIFRKLVISTILLILNDIRYPHGAADKLVASEHPELVNRWSIKDLLRYEGNRFGETFKQTSSYTQTWLLNIRSNNIRIAMKINKYLMVYNFPYM